MDIGKRDSMSKGKGRGGVLKKRFMKNMYMTTCSFINC